MIAQDTLGMAAPTAKDAAGASAPSGEPQGGGTGVGPWPGSGGGSGANSEAADLLARMRSGDREAASRFVQEYGEIIRRRVRGKLGKGMRRLFDSQEILSTVSRRLDRFVRDGQVRAGDTPQLWGLVFKMVDAALVDKVRVYQRLKGVEGEDSDFAARALDRLREREGREDDGPELELDAAFRCLKNDTDRELLAMWLNDVPLSHIAAAIETTPEAARKRWQGIRAQLRERWLMEGPA